jgi:acyl carrier protein
VKASFPLPRSSERVLSETVGIVREVCRDAGLRLDAGSHLDEIAPLDSLRLMETVAVLEDRFRVEVETNALGQLVRIEDIVALILRAQPAG